MYTGTVTFQHHVLCHALTDALQDCDDGFTIRYRFDYKQFNLGRSRAKAMVHACRCARWASQYRHRKKSSTKRKTQGIYRACNNYYLKISTKTTAQGSVSANTLVAVQRAYHASKWTKATGRSCRQNSSTTDSESNDFFCLGETQNCIKIDKL